MDKDFKNYLQKWCDEHNVLTESEKNFWICFENCSKDQPEEFLESFPNNKHGVSVSLYNICFSLDVKFDYGQPTIQITFDILLNGKVIGWYREIYFTNGEFVDDFFCNRLVTLLSISCISHLLFPLEMRVFL